MLAERCSTKEPIDEKCGHKIGDDHPGSQQGACPEVKRFIGPKEDDEEHERQPFPRKPAWPGTLCSEESPGESAGKKEGASETEQVTYQQER